MRGRTALAKAVPRGEKLLTLKAQGILTNGSVSDLREELYLVCRATQQIIDFLWKFDKLPNLNQVHQMFYKMLRRQGFRAHQAKQMYKHALALVKSSRRNNGKKPILRKLSARIDKYDAKVDLENRVVVVKLRDREFVIKLLHRNEYLKKFIGKKWYEVMISIDRNGRIWISIPFRWEYDPYIPRKLISLDINLRKVVMYDGRKIRRMNTRFIEALSLKIHAERIQKRYPRMWRYNRRILGRIRKLHRRSRNIVIDWSRKFAKYIALKARKTRSSIVLEDLNELWFNSSKKSSSIADRLSRFSYRKLQTAIMAKAIEYNVPIMFVNPKNTSSLCPRCGAKLVYEHRLATCRKCGLIADRDTIGAMNIYLRGLRSMWGSLGSSPNAPPMNDEARGRGRRKDEPMMHYIKSYKNI